MSRSRTQQRADSATTNVSGVLQIFVRDLGFVVDDTFVWCNPKIDCRRLELEGLKSAIDQQGIKILVGIGEHSDRARTSQNAASSLKELFSDREIIEVETRASDYVLDDPQEHALHLDCAFQMIGSDYAILCDQGFSGRPEPIHDLVSEDHLISVSPEEMFHLWPNVFTISPTTVVSAPSFTRLNKILRNAGMTIIEVPYEEVGKLGAPPLW